MFLELKQLIFLKFRPGERVHQDDPRATFQNSKHGSTCDSSWCLRRNQPARESTTIQEHYVRRTHRGRPISDQPHPINHNALKSWRCVMLIPKSKALAIPVPKEPNFRIPEGKYRAKITTVRKLLVERSDGIGETLRLLYEVQVPSLPRCINLAKSEYRLDTRQ